MNSHPFESAAAAAKVLFLPAPGKLGMLVEHTGKRRRRRRQRTLRFADAHAALDWCLANGAALIYVPSRPAVALN